VSRARAESPDNHLDYTPLRAAAGRRSYEHTVQRRDTGRQDL